MKKTLNDSLREEFKQILKTEEYQEIIKSKKLDPNIIQGAFEKLVKGNSGSMQFDEEVESTRSEFENYIINTLKTMEH